MEPSLILSVIGGSIVIIVLAFVSMYYMARYFDKQMNSMTAEFEDYIGPKKK